MRTRYGRPVPPRLAHATFLALLMLGAGAITACGTSDSNEAPAPASENADAGALAEAGPCAVVPSADASAPKAAASLLGYDAINVLASPYSAHADGKTDDTAAIQKAIDDAGRYAMPSAGHYNLPTDPGHGGLVFLPAGNYLVAGALTVPPYVTLIGEFAGPPSTTTPWVLPSASAPVGTVILATGNAGAPDAAPLISLGSDAAVEGIAIDYPDQTDTNPPVAYPWSIRSLGIQSSVVNVTLVNAYRGIDFGNTQTARYFGSGIYGQPLSVGIVTDHSLDIGRLENVHFTPIWRSAMASPAYTYQRTYGTGISILRTDWGIFDTIELRGYGHGIYFGSSPVPCTVTGECGSTNGQLSNVTVEADIGLDITGLSRFGVHLTGFTYTPLAGGVVLLPIWMRAGGSSGGFLTITHGTLDGPIQQAALWQSPSGLTLTDTTIGAWSAAKPSVDLRAGQLIAQRVTFAAAGSVAIAVTAGARATVTSNKLGGNTLVGTMTAAGNTP